MKNLGKTYANPCNWVIAVGAGSGCEVFGTMEASCHVFANQIATKFKASYFKQTWPHWDATRATSLAAEEHQQQAQLTKDARETLDASNATQSEECSNCGPSAQMPSTMKCDQYGRPI